MNYKRIPFSCDTDRNILLCSRAGINKLQKAHNNLENLEELCIQGIRLKLAKYFAKAEPTRYVRNHILLNSSIIVQFNDGLRK